MREFVSIDKLLLRPYCICSPVRKLLAGPPQRVRGDKGYGQHKYMKHRLRIGFINYSWVYPAPPRLKRIFFSSKTYSSTARTPAARPQYKSSNPLYWGTDTRPPFLEFPQPGAALLRTTGGRVGHRPHSLSKTALGTTRSLLVPLAPRLHGCPRQTREPRGGKISD